MNKISVMIDKDVWTAVKEKLIQKHGGFPDINNFIDFVVNNIVMLNYEKHIDSQRDKND